jgi:REP element-mobilizing transposase RayT
MPARNSLKDYMPESFYHIYNRGVNKQGIFHDEQDYRFFLKLLRRYLDSDYRRQPGEIPRPSFANSVELIAFCLMPNHFHILIYQIEDAQALEKLFRGIMTAYVMYYNNKYRRIGPLFQGRYKASLVDNDRYLQHISRYIHLNPVDIDAPYQTYPYSSFSAYQNDAVKSFIKPARILEQIGGDYPQFVAEYADEFKQRAKDDSDYAISGLS